MMEGREGEYRVAASLAAAGAPPHIAATFDALQFRNPSSHRVTKLSAAEWQRLLSWCDTRQLTLTLPHSFGPFIPPELCEDIEQRRARYQMRFERLKCALFEIVAVFGAANLEFIMLKGLSHAPVLTPDAIFRAQGDIDLWLTGPSVYKAEEALQSLGYVSVGVSKSRHLSPLMRPGNWKWAGDLFDPAMPISVELHYELWSDKDEYIEAPGLEAFWQRRVVRDFDGHKVCVLRDEDLLGFAALHFLLHLLHGDLPLQRAWEIARFLDLHADDTRFWESWQTIHTPRLRRLETVVYDLVTLWFGCRWPAQLETEVMGFSKPVRSWLEDWFLSPLVSQWAPNKRELWLHLALIDAWPNKSRVFIRRLLPLIRPHLEVNAAAKVSPADTARAALQRLRFTSSRLFRHLRTLLPTIFDGLRLTLQRRL
jgi:hypothetical protein